MPHKNFNISDSKKSFFGFHEGDFYGKKIALKFCKIRDYL